MKKWINLPHIDLKKKKNQYVESLRKTELWESEAALFIVHVGAHRRTEQVNSLVSINDHKYLVMSGCFYKSDFCFHARTHARTHTHTRWEYRESLIWCFIKTVKSAQIKLCSKEPVSSEGP